MIIIADSDCLCSINHQKSPNLKITGFLKQCGWTLALAAALTVGINFGRAQTNAAGETNGSIQIRLVELQGDVQIIHGAGNDFNDAQWKPPIERGVRGDFNVRPQLKEAVERVLR